MLEVQVTVPGRTISGAAGDTPMDGRHEWRPGRLAGAVWLVAAGFVALELAVSARYGFHRDELYFVIAGRHPAMGYVDQPPFAPLLTRVATLALGTGPSAIRVFPAVAGAAVVVTAGYTASLLGGLRRAQVLAALAMACAPVTLAASHLANTTVYDLLAWSLAVACSVAAVHCGRPRAWLGAGIAIGLGLENKDLILLLVASLAIGVLAAGRASAFADGWLWAGAVIALALWAPNLIWQATHHWPEHAMSVALHREHSTGSDYLTVVPAQLVYLGPAAVPLAVIGIRRLIRDRALHFLAIALGLVVAFVLVYIPGRPYYTDGMLALAFAAGSVAIEQRPAPNRMRPWLLAPPIGLLVGLVLILPVLPQAALAHIKGIHKLNYDLTETIGWPQLTQTVIRIYDQLPARQRTGTAIYTANYGEASALILYGSRQLPPVLSAHNNYWLWGPGHAPDKTVIVIGSADPLRANFASCRQVGVIHSPHDVDNDENGVTISICTTPAGPWQQFWPTLKHYD